MVDPYVWNDVDHTQIVEILALPRRYLPGPSWVYRIVVPALGSPVPNLTYLALPGVCLVSWETRYSENDEVSQKRENMDDVDGWFSFEIRRKNPRNSCLNPKPQAGKVLSFPCHCHHLVSLERRGFQNDKFLLVNYTTNYLLLPWCHQFIRITIGCRGILYQHDAK